MTPKRRTALLAAAAIGLTAAGTAAAIWARPAPLVASCADPAQDVTGFGEPERFDRLAQADLIGFELRRTGQRFEATFDIAGALRPLAGLPVARSEAAAGRPPENDGLAWRVTIDDGSGPALSMSLAVSPAGPGRPAARSHAAVLDRESQLAQLASSGGTADRRVTVAASAPEAFLAQDVAVRGGSSRYVLAGGTLTRTDDECGAPNLPAPRAASRPSSARTFPEGWTDGG